MTQQTPEQIAATWAQYANDFNAMTDVEIELQCEQASNDLAEAESWLEAVAAWDAAGRPRRPRRN